MVALATVVQLGFMFGMLVGEVVVVEEVMVVKVAEGMVVKVWTWR